MVLDVEAAGEATGVSEMGPSRGSDRLVYDEVRNGVLCLNIYLL